MHEMRTTERAIIVTLESGNEEDDRASLDEIEALAATAGAEFAGEFTQKRERPHPVYFIGQGKAEELFEEVKALEADLVIVDAELTPTQQRHLEEAAETRVIDRTQLILDIFARRANSSEGKLQVELAQLNYMLPRLVGARTELSRLGGGIGTRGPGETKLESDRRRIRKRISDLTKEIDEVRQHRSVQKKARRKLPYPTAAIVGYTSAGKSTLLNTLTGSEVLVDAKLFATLDPTTRRVEISQGWSALMTDTVGFIRNLPHTLVAAFRATLEEVSESDFLIHVVDASHPYMKEQVEAVHEVLRELEADGLPMITVFNKCDLVADQYVLRKMVADTPDSVYISAKNRQGIGQLMDVVTRTLQSLLVRVSLDIPYERSDLLSLCYDSGRVLSAEYVETGVLVEAEVSREVLSKLKKFRI